MNAIMKEEHSSVGTEHDRQSTMDRDRLWLLDYIAKTDEATLLFLANKIKSHHATRGQG